MPNRYDGDSRSPSTARLYVVGMVFVAILAATVTLLLAKSRGALDPFVRISAQLVNVGDGLPVKSDVKFRGVLVGFVSGVIPAQAGHLNVVNVNLKPQLAAGIPDTVTARVVPSNVFAVSSIQLVDNHTNAAPLHSGAVIHEDQTLPTVLFQTTLEKFRRVLAAIGRDPTETNVGWLTALGEATSGRGNQLQQAGHDLNQIVAQLNTIVSDQPGPGTLTALTAATAGLKRTAPELLDALNQAVTPMRTLTEKRAELSDFLAAGMGTLGKLGRGFDNQSDRLISITTKLTPVLGALADHAGSIHSIAVNGQQMTTKIVDETWDWNTNNIRTKAVIALTPTRTYVRADCPHYGSMMGPSCFTAPEVPTAPALTPSLGSMGFPLPPNTNENRPNFAPPRGSVLPPDAPRPDGPAQSGPPPNAPPLPAEAPPLPANPPGAVPQAAIIGGNVGPVGSREEQQQLSFLLGGKANAASEFLFAPLVRGHTVFATPAAGAPR